MHHGKTNESLEQQLSTLKTLVNRWNINTTDQIQQSARCKCYCSCFLAPPRWAAVVNVPGGEKKKGADLRGFLLHTFLFSSLNPGWSIFSVLKWSLNTAPRCTVRHDTWDREGKKHTIHHESLRPGRQRRHQASHLSLCRCFYLPCLFSLLPSPTLAVHPFLPPILPSLLFLCISSFLPPSITLSLRPFRPALIPFSHHRLLLPTLLLSDFQFVHGRQYTRETGCRVRVCVCVLRFSVCVCPDILGTRTLMVKWDHGCKEGSVCWAQLQRTV